jgi:uncharacterized protein YjbI with pentapeptide repeats
MKHTASPTGLQRLPAHVAIEDVTGDDPALTLIQGNQQSGCLVTYGGVQVDRYLDRITELLQDGLAESQPDDPWRGVAEALALVALARLHGPGKDRVLLFLYESGLITGTEPVISLDAANLDGLSLFDVGDVTGTKPGEIRARDKVINLSHVNLKGAHLNEAYFFSVNLSDADLSGCSLQQARLGKCNLVGAQLSQASLAQAFLIGVDLRQAHLKDTILIDANLTNADLRHADLSGAVLINANLSGADLRGATVTAEQLAQAASLKGATLPDGTIHE